MAAVLVLVLVVEKRPSIDVLGVEVGSNWLTPILAAIGLGTLRARITGKQVTGWIALVYIVAVVIATAAIFAAGRKAGVAAEAAKAREAELKSHKEASDAKDRMLEAGDRDALAARLRDGTI